MCGWGVGAESLPRQQAVGKENSASTAIVETPADVPLCLGDGDVRPLVLVRERPKGARSGARGVVLAPTRRIFELFCTELRSMLQERGVLAPLAMPVEVEYRTTGMDFCMSDSRSYQCEYGSFGSRGMLPGQGREVLLGVIVHQAAEGGVAGRADANTAHPTEVAVEGVMVNEHEETGSLCLA